MTIHYPDGRSYRDDGQRQGESRSVDYGKRGMTLEEDLNVTNRYYLETDRAVIYKKPTPIQIARVDYPRRSAAKITEAYFRKASTTDYNGVYRGKYIDFEAKETTQPTSIPLKNFHSHQLAHMRRIKRHGGIGFIIVRFTRGGSVYLLDADYLDAAWTEGTNGGRKSIPLSLFQKHGYPIETHFAPRLDYLTAVDAAYF